MIYILLAVLINFLLGLFLSVWYTDKRYTCIEKSINRLSDNIYETDLKRFELEDKIDRVNKSPQGYRFLCYDEKNNSYLYKRADIEEYQDKFIAIKK
ncbi:MAG: hypothetical protein ACOWWR_18455 [Eubacteriales bacterium]